MEAVIDANIIFRILISAGNILDVIFNVRIYAPLRLKEEFEKHKEEIIAKSKLPSSEFEEVYQEIFGRIEFIPEEEYSKFIPKAKEILKGHDKDEDFIALCMHKSCKLWTYEKRMFKIGYGISTKELSKEIGDFV